MAADVHHLDDSIFVCKAHIGYVAASGSVGSHVVIAWHYYLALVVALDNEFTIFLQFNNLLFTLPGLTEDIKERD